jgi:hypothetical protein
MGLVTHLECSLTGERYKAGQIHNLSKAGKPLLVRYDLEAAKRTLTRESIASREPGMWKWRELLPHDGEPVSLGEIETPLIPLSRTGPNLLVKDEGRLPTGSFKARGLAMAVTMAKQLGIERIAMPTNGNAGAALAAYGARAGIDTIVICPTETPEINVTETAAYSARVYVADGLGYPDSGRDRRRILPPLGELVALLEGPHHRRAALRLDRIHARSFRTDQANGLELVECFPHADEARAASSRVEDRVRKLPTELLGKLEPHHLLALDPVRLLQRRTVEPQALRCPLPHQCTAFVDLAVRHIDARTVRSCLCNVDRRRLRRADDDRPDAGSSAVRRQGGARIAVGRHGDALDSEMPRHADRHGKATRLKRSGWKPPLVFDEQVRPTCCRQRHDRCFGLSEADGFDAVRQREQFAPLPHAWRAVGEALASQCLRRSVEIVPHQQRLADARQIVQPTGLIALAG